MSMVCANPMCTSRSLHVSCKCGVRYCSNGCYEDHRARGHKADCERLQFNHMEPTYKPFNKLAREFLDLAQRWEPFCKDIWNDTEAARIQRNTTKIVWKYDFESMEALRYTVKMCTGIFENPQFESYLSTSEQGQFHLPTLPGKEVLVKIVTPEPWWRNDSCFKDVYELVEDCDSHAVVVCLSIPFPGRTTEMMTTGMVFSPQTGGANVKQHYVATEGSGQAARKKVLKKVLKLSNCAGVNLSNVHPELQKKLDDYVADGIGGWNATLVLSRTEVVRITACADIAAQKSSREPFVGPPEKSPDATSRLQQMSYQVLLRETVKMGVDLQEFGPKFANKFGRGSFHVHFDSLDALDKCQPTGIKEFLQSGYDHIMSDPRSRDLPSCKLEGLRDEVQKLIAPALPEGQVGNFILYQTSSNLGQQFNDQSNGNRDLMMLRTYDPAASFCFSADVDLQTGKDDHTTVVGVCTFGKLSGEAELFRKLLTDEEECRLETMDILPGTLLSLDFVLWNRMFHPLVRDTAALLAPIDFVTKALYSSSNSSSSSTSSYNGNVDGGPVYVLFLKCVDVILKKLDSDALHRYEALLRARQSESLFTSGLEAHPAVADAFAKLCGHWGGRAAYFNALNAYRNDRDEENKSHLATMGVLLTCDACGACAPKMLRCSICRAATYCDGMCQKKNWKTHKLTCTKPRQQN